MRMSVGRRENNGHGWRAWMTRRQVGRGSGWLPGGRIRPVVSVPGPGGIAELLAYSAWLARLRPACRCGRPRLGSGRTCGSAECVAQLREQKAGR